MVFVCLGCSGTGFNSPVCPGTTTQCDMETQSSNRTLWGLWEVAIDRATGEIDIVPLRGAMFNCNVQQFLSPPFVPTHQIKIVLLPGTNLPDGYVECEVSLTHPFQGLEMYKGLRCSRDFHGGRVEGQRTRS